MTYPEGMQRICLAVEYRGASFQGFQAQAHTDNTVQHYLQQSLSSVADEAITVICAGRTDAGVHASGQIVHFDTLAQRPQKAWSLGVNARLPEGVAVQWAQAITPSFHARFSAQARTYRYVIYNAAARSPVLAQNVTWQKRPLNAEAMAQAAAYLWGEHDFSAFRAAQCQARNPVRTIEYLRVATFRRFIVLEVKANAFLHHMVRNIAGALMAVGAGDKPVEWLRDLRESRDRRLGAATASPHGLYLVKVNYPAQFQLPVMALGPEWLPEDLPWITL